MKKVIILLLSLIVVVLCLWGLLFKKTNDKYLISEISLRKVQLVGKNIEDFDLSNGGKKLGVGITIKKEFVSNELSKRQLVLSSQESGINGLLDTNQLNGFKVFLDGSHQYELKKDLFCYDLESLQPIVSFEENKNAVNLASFIKSIKDNDRFVSGIRLDGLEKIFWLESDSAEIIEAFKRLPLKNNFQKNK